MEREAKIQRDKSETEQSNHHVYTLDSQTTGAISFWPFFGQTGFTNSQWHRTHPWMEFDQRRIWGRNRMPGFPHSRGQNPALINQYFKAWKKVPKSVDHKLNFVVPFFQARGILGKRIIKSWGPCESVIVTSVIVGNCNLKSKTAPEQVCNNRNTMLNIRSEACI